MNRAFITTKREFRKYLKEGYLKYNSISFLPKEKDISHNIYIYEINEDEIHLTGFYFVIELCPVLCNNAPTGFFNVKGNKFPHLRFNKRNLNRIYLIK